MCLYRWLWEETQILRILSGPNNKNTRTTKNRQTWAYYSWKTIPSLNLSTHTKKTATGSGPGGHLFHSAVVGWVLPGWLQSGILKREPSKQTAGHSTRELENHLISSSSLTSNIEKPQEDFRSTPATHRLSVKGTDFLNPHSQKEIRPGLQLGLRE